MKKGTHLSEEAKQKISQAKKGTAQKPEAVERRIQSRLARIAKSGYTEAELNKCEKISQSKKGYHWSPEMRAKLSKAHIGGKVNLTPEGRERKRQAMTGNRFQQNRTAPCSEETKRKIGAANSVTMKTNWQEDDYVAMQMKARHCSPNKSEQKLTDLIDDNLLPFKFVGDGQFILGGKCPDYIGTGDKKQIIELFGAYWHGVLDIGKRVEYFRQFGYSTLIIWEEELKDADKVLKRIKRFITLK